MIPIEEQFKYHPPVSEWRKAKHDVVNDAALAFALKIGETIPCYDPLYQTILNAIQQARMFANQSITYQELQNERDKSEDLARVREELGFSKRLENLPQLGFSVLAEIERQYSGGKRRSYAVVYHNGKTWCLDSDSKPLEERDRVIRWQPCSNIFGEE